MWNAGSAPDPEFARDWRARLGRTPHANFSMSLEHLEWQAAHGAHSRAVLLDEGSRHGAMVLRDESTEVVTGYPWRWQIVIEGADPADPAGMTAADADWFFAQARALAGGRRLRFLSPGSPRHALSGYVAGQTVLIDLTRHTEQQLFDALHSSRRRLARRCLKAGYEVVETHAEPLERSFALLMIEMHERRHHLRMPALADIEPPGESWHEWDLPWHWLIVALKSGSVGAGFGAGRQAGGMVDGRASASSEEAMDAGANSLVWWEGIRRARLAGHTWMNLCGSTRFKRQFGGVLVPIQCRLGGGIACRLPNLVELLTQTARPVAARWVNIVKQRVGRS